MSATPESKPLRADAARNREKLLDAAIALFSERGTDVSLELIAKTAGVGVGTLYRHFPERGALIEAAYRAEVDHLLEAADDLLAAHEPDEALARWLDRFVEYAEAKRGMKDALLAMGVMPQMRDHIVAAASKLVDAAVAAGAIRSDFTGEDLMRATGAIWSMPADDPQWPEHARKLLGLIMDGLRAGARTSS